MVKAILIYTIVGIETSQGGTLGVRGKEYRIKVDFNFDVRPRVGEKIRYGSKTFTIASIVHLNVPERSTEMTGYARTSFLEVHVGYEDWNYPKGSDPDEQMPTGLRVTIAKLQNEGWRLYDEKGQSFVMKESKR